MFSEETDFMIDGFYSMRYAEEADSTNLWIRRLHDEGAPEGTVAVADRQTEGRGRLGRNWLSPKGDGIFFSILLMPDIDLSKNPMLSLVMGLSVRKAVEEAAGCEAQIKWPNDVILAGKKVCGILTELILENGTQPYVILGVGINNANESFAGELEDKATSIRLACGKAADQEALLEKVLNHFRKDYREFQKDGDLRSFEEEYNRHLVNIGKSVRILEKSGEYTAVAEGIDADGALMIRKEDGTAAKVTSGEVSVRGIYGYT